MVRENTRSSLVSGRAGSAVLLIVGVLGIRATGAG